MASDDPLVGYSTDSVRFERLLGRGAMGAVYKGVQLGLERPVAIKVIASHLAADADYIARFEREAHTIGKLVHPNLIACHDFGPCNGPGGEKLYLMVLEFVDGWTLGSLAKKGKLTVRQVLELHRQAAEGLHAAHRLGIVHRDVKPENIMVTRDGQAKLADFGLARQLSDDASLTAAGSILGSPAFMSPEACRGEEPTPASDQYSLGCSLFQVLAGRSPYVASSALAVMQGHIMEPVPKLAPLRPDLAVLQPIIDGSLAKEPTDRYPDCHALAKALQVAAPHISRDVLAGKATATSTSAPQPAVEITKSTERRTGLDEGDVTIATAASRPRQRRAVVAAAATIALGVLVVAAWPRAPATSTPVQPLAVANPKPVDGDQSKAPDTAPVLGPPSPTKPTDAPAAAPNAADVASLDEAERYLRANHLGHAQRVLDALVVSGELKQRKRAIQDKLDAAWTARKQGIAQQLDAAQAKTAGDPAGAANDLAAIEISDRYGDRFADLAARRDDLLAKARAAQAKTGSAAPPPRQNGGQPAPAPLAPTTPTAPATAAKVTTLDAEALGGLSTSPGDLRLPALEPLGTFPPRMSRRWLDRSALLMHLPTGTGGQDGVIALVEGGGRARNLRVDVRAVEGPDTGTHFVTSVQLPASGWCVLSIRLDDHARARRELLLSTSDFADTSFYAAAGAFADNGMPTWADLKATPGTLLPCESGDTAPLCDLARDIRRRRPAFPQYEQLRIGLPDALFQNAFDRRQRVIDAFDSRLLPTPDHPELRPEHLSTSRNVLEYSVVGSIRFLLDRALGDHDRGNFYAHILATAKPAPDGLDATIGKQFKDAIEKAPGLFPIVVLSADGWEGDTRKSWQAFTRGLHAQVPGLPIIDLAQVPIMLARQGQPLDLSSKAGQEMVWDGLEAGLLELRQRLDWALR
jgi:serine/threonine-protein kinase